MSAMLSSPDNPQLLQNDGKLTFKSPAPAKAVYANKTVVKAANRSSQNLPFVQLTFSDCRRLLCGSDQRVLMAGKL